MIGAPTYVIAPNDHAYTTSASPTVFKEAVFIISLETIFAQSLFYKNFDSGVMEKPILKGKNGLIPKTHDWADANSLDAYF